MKKRLPVTLIKNRTKILFGFFLLIFCSYSFIFPDKSRKIDKTLNNPPAVVGELREFRLALAATGNFTQYYGSADGVLAALNTIEFELNKAFKRDFGIQLNLIYAPNLVFSNGNYDPFNKCTDENGDPIEGCNGDFTKEELMNINQQICDATLGSGQYDLAHVLDAQSGEYWGGAAVASVCDGSSKAKGISNAGIWDINAIEQFIFHNIAHQLGALHTYSTALCGNGTPGSRYETVGPPPSIMGLDNCCSNYTSLVDSFQSFFHSASILQVNAHLDSIDACYVSTPAGNPTPNADAGADFMVPKQTPIRLVGRTNSEASVTFTWEQFDGDGPALNELPVCTTTDGALFKNYNPNGPNGIASSGVKTFIRTIPSVTNILTGNNIVSEELLPCAPRTLNFKLTVRDNHLAGGQTAMDDIAITVMDTGPFEITYPNSETDYWTNGPLDSIEWTVNGTDAHCPFVDIYVSTDGGYRFTKNIGEYPNGVPNTGKFYIEEEDFSFDQTQARVMVACHVDGEVNGSTFFDINDADFTIYAGCFPDGITFSSQAELDDFPELYPDCVTILGDVIVSGFGIENLGPLLQLKHIKGDLIIKENGRLHDLLGLSDALKVDGELIIKCNPVLVDCEMIAVCEHLKKEGVEIQVSNNGKEAVSGLDQNCNTTGMVAFQCDPVNNAPSNPADCHPDVDYILDQDFENFDPTTNRSFHDYEVVTTVCDQNVDDPEICNVDYIYQFIKDNSIYNIATPLDYPFDLVNPLGLVDLPGLPGLTEADFETIAHNINSWEINPDSRKPYGGIDYVTQVYDFAPPAKEITTVPFFAGNLILGGTGTAIFDREDLTNTMELFNKKEIENCREYHLVHSGNYITGKELLYVMDNFCGDSLESIIYDPIYMNYNDTLNQIINFTARGHWLYPGFIDRRVVEDECGAIKVVTHGLGLHHCGDNFGGETNAKINVIIGSIIFKNSDLRLRSRLFD